MAIPERIFERFVLFFCFLTRLLFLLMGYISLSHPVLFALDVCFCILWCAELIK
jgi:hypothetical protein